jgi:predicted RNase H-like HicB family nuclease
MGNLEKVARAQGSGQCALTICPHPPHVKQLLRPAYPRPFTLSLEVFTLSYAGRVRYLHTSTPSITMNLMTTRDFKVFLEPDEDYHGYVVVCPSIPGCYSQGKTVPEALANIREAIDLCLEDMESRGEEIPDPNNVLIGSVVVTR